MCDAVNLRNVPLYKLSCRARLAGWLGWHSGQLLTDTVYDRSGSDSTTPPRAPTATSWDTTITVLTDVTRIK